MNRACRRSCRSSRGCEHYRCFSCLPSYTKKHISSNAVSYIYILTHHDITKIRKIILPVVDGVLVAGVVGVVVVDVEVDVVVVVVLDVEVDVVVGDVVTVEVDVVVGVVVEVDVVVVGAGGGPAEIVIKI